MEDRNRLRLHDRHADSPVAILPAETYLPGEGFSRREPHLLDYLVILRKHQWLILTFLVTVVTIVTIASFGCVRSM